MWLKSSNRLLFVTQFQVLNILYIYFFQVIEFSELNKPKVQLLSHVLTTLLTKYEDYVVMEVFQRISVIKKLATLKEGLKIFMKHFLLRGKNANNELLQGRIEMAETVLDSRSMGV